MTIYLRDPMIQINKINLFVLSMSVNLKTEYCATRRNRELRGI